MLGYRERSQKQRNKEKMAEVRRKGKAGEERFKRQRELWGDKVKKTGKGHDGIVTKTNMVTGKKTKYYVEIKTGPKAKLSPLQKKTQKKMGDKRYKVIRMSKWGI